MFKFMIIIFLQTESKKILYLNSDISPTQYRVKNFHVRAKQLSQTNNDRTETLHLL
jgi:hypothetical protein